MSSDAQGSDQKRSASSSGAAGALADSHAPGDRQNLPPCGLADDAHATRTNERTRDDLVELDQTELEELGLV
jgi:hypothetical protein